MDNEQSDRTKGVISDGDEKTMLQDGVEDELSQPLCIARYFEGIRTLSAKKHSRCLSRELYHFFKEER